MGAFEVRYAKNEPYFESLITKFSTSYSKNYFILTC